MMTTPKFDNSHAAQDALRLQLSPFPLPSDLTDNFCFELIKKLEHAGLEPTSFALGVAFTDNNRFIVAISGEMLSKGKKEAWEWMLKEVPQFAKLKVVFSSYADRYDFQSDSSQPNAHCAEPKLYKSKAKGGDLVIAMSVRWFSLENKPNPYPLTAFKHNGTPMLPCATCRMNAEFLVTGDARVEYVKNNEKINAEEWNVVIDKSQVYKKMNEQLHYAPDPYEGFVKFWDPVSKYGFIRRHVGDKDGLRFFKSNWKSESNPVLNAKVIYTRRKNQKGDWVIDTVKLA